jgi:hypothetical protein
MYLKGNIGLLKNDKPNYEEASENTLKKSNTPIAKTIFGAMYKEWKYRMP